MIKAHNGMFLLNETAANDSICQEVMASYINQLKAETARRDRIRQGLEAAPEGQWGNWSISDRD
jgi:predicted transcriptional regulator